MNRTETDRRVAELVEAFNDYPDGARQIVVAEWPELFFAVSRLVRYVEVSRERRQTYPLFDLRGRAWRRDLRRVLGVRAKSP